MRGSASRHRLVELEDAIQEANQIFPRQVVSDQPDRRNDGKGVRGKAGDSEVEKTGDDDAKGREQNRKQRASKADGEV